MSVRRTAAFTLIELLVVLVILGVLARVLLPVLLHARSAALHTAAVAYVGGVYKAAAADYLETGQTPPGDCRRGYVAGAYSVPAPVDGLVYACSVSVPLMPQVDGLVGTGEALHAP